MRSAPRRPEGFNLAFLDIMACGLGAIILIFMLSKYHTARSDSPATALQTELTTLQQATAALERQTRALSAQIESLQHNAQQQKTRAAQTDETNSQAAAEIIDLTKQIAGLQQQAEQQTLSPEPPSAETPTETAGDQPREQHLIGLRVSGKRILILLDHSASMAAERLVDIIKVKVADIATKKAAHKWQRTMAITDWILQRVPEGSEYLIIHYNDDAEFLTEPTWQRGDDETARATTAAALQKLYPHAATNLHRALLLITTNDLRPTDIYIITDSLPSQGADGLAALQRLAGCGILTGRTTVSGKCRLALFAAAVKSFSRKLKVRTNAILLPIEGDPQAAYAYWNWSAASGGTMISPAASWP